MCKERNFFLTSVTSPSKYNAFGFIKLRMTEGVKIKITHSFLC